MKECKRTFKDFNDVKSLYSGFQDNLINDSEIRKSLLSLLKNNSNNKSISRCCTFKTNKRRLRSISKFSSKISNYAGSFQESLSKCRLYYISHKRISNRKFKEMLRNKNEINVLKQSFQMNLNNYKNLQINTNQSHILDSTKPNANDNRTKVIMPYDKSSKSVDITTSSYGHNANLSQTEFCSSFGNLEQKISNGTSNPSLCDPNLDNFETFSHFSDSAATITKNQLQATPFIHNNAILQSRLSYFNCSEKRYLNRHRSPILSNHVKFQQQIKVENELAAELLARSTTSDSNQGSLKRNKGRSNQSLCSCDAGGSTEIVPDPNRPLFQYSLDRKRKLHTYTCEQNAQILIRLEREKNLRINSCLNLTERTSSKKISIKRHPEEQINNVDIPSPPPPPCGRKLSLTHFRYQSIEDFKSENMQRETRTVLPFNLNRYQKNQTLDIPTIDVNGIKDYCEHETGVHKVITNNKNKDSDKNLISYNNITNNNYKYNKNNNYKNNDNDINNDFKHKIKDDDNNNINNKNSSNNINSNDNNNNKNNNNNNNNNNSNNKNGNRNNKKMHNNNNYKLNYSISSNNNNIQNFEKYQINKSDCKFNNKNISVKNGEYNSCFKPNSIRTIENFGCSSEGPILNDCSSKLLNCTNGSVSRIPDVIRSEQKSKLQDYSFSLDDASCNVLYPQRHNQNLSDNNDNFKANNQENTKKIQYHNLNYDSYIPCGSTCNEKESYISFNQDPSNKYKKNFDNQPKFEDDFGSVATSNSIGPGSSCSNKLTQFDCVSKESVNFSNLKYYHSKDDSFNIDNIKFTNNGEEEFSNLTNGKCFSQSLTNFISIGKKTIDCSMNSKNSEQYFCDRDNRAHSCQNWQRHNYHDLSAKIIPYAQFKAYKKIQIPEQEISVNNIYNSTTSVNGGLSCNFDNSLISCSFSTIGSGNSGLKEVGAGILKNQFQRNWTCNNLKESSTGLSGCSGSSLMPWKHRKCSSKSSSSSVNNSLRFDVAKHWLAVSSLLLLVGAASVAVPLALRVAASAPFEERLHIATQILESVPLIDGHNDLPWNIRKFLHNKLNDFNFDEDLRNVTPWAKSQWSHTDLQRLRSGRVSAQFWAAYVPCEAQHRDAVQLTLEQIDVIKRLTERYSVLKTCTSVTDIIEAHKNHKLCSLTGVEGGHSLGGSLAVLRTLYAIGVRYMTLTSTCHTPWADSSYADAPTFNVKHGGLTSFGKTIIREMNRLGMIVDLSHVSTGTMRDALLISEAPVIFSHSSAYELCNSSRNVKDDILLLLSKNGGIVMVNFYSKFLSCSENSTVHDAVAHINHIRRIAGIDHVGLGAGYDGINFTPKGLEDVSSYPTLFAELLGEGWSVEDLKKLAGENFLRVMKKVETIRDEKKKAGIRPYEDHSNFKTEDPYNCTSS